MNQIVREILAVRTDTPAPVRSELEKRVENMPIELDADDMEALDWLLEDLDKAEITYEMAAWYADMNPTIENKAIAWDTWKVFERCQWVADMLRGIALDLEMPFEEDDDISTMSFCFHGFSMN